MSKFFGLAIVTLLVAACGGEDNDGRSTSGTPESGREEATMPEQESGRDSAVLAGEWRLTEIAGAALPEGAPTPTLNVAPDGTVSGNSGVNRFTGKLGSGEGKLFGPMASTRMAGPPAAMALEDRFLEAMSAVTAFEIVGEQLVLSGPDGALLTFER